MSKGIVLVCLFVVVVYKYFHTVDVVLQIFERH